MLGSCPKAAAAPASTGAVPISDAEFKAVRDLLYREVGISLSEHKRALVCGRLGSRLTTHGLNSFTAYLRLLQDSRVPGELQIAIDLLTTNETSFFREPKHFEFLRTTAAAHRRGRPFRVWSAASSSGEEAYSIAMQLAETLGEGPWEVFASDISTRVLERARSALYALERAETIPRALLQRHCLKGSGPYEGSFLLSRAIRARVKFDQINLTRPLPEVGEFDLIFLRNVLIYFDSPTKRAVVERLARQLRLEGRLVIGHSESLNGITQALEAERPTLYRVAAGARDRMQA